MRVGDVMTRRVRTLSQYQSIDEAAGVLRFWSFRHLPVVDAEDRVVGMVTTGDLLQAAREGGDLQDEPVSRFMHRPVITAREEETLQAAIQRMVKEKVHALPVLGPSDRLVGIVADRDLLAAVVSGHPELPDLDTVTAEAVMRPKPVTVDPEATLGDAAQLLLQRHFRHLPVVDGAGRLVGMLSERDVRARLGSDLPGYPESSLEALTQPVSEAMTPDPLSVRTSTCLAEVIELLADALVGALPVVDEGETLRGIISYVDVLRWLKAPRPVRAA